MGKNLANEIHDFISNRIYLAKVRISFIGFSMGGIIVRAALPFLELYKDRMNSFITLSSPHLGIFHFPLIEASLNILYILGYIYNPSKLIDAGIWIMQKILKTKSLEQLAMQDHKDID